MLFLISTGYYAFSSTFFIEKSLKFSPNFLIKIKGVETMLIKEKVISEEFSQEGLEELIELIEKNRDSVKWLTAECYVGINNTLYTALLKFHELLEILAGVCGDVQMKTIIVIGDDNPNTIVKLFTDEPNISKEIVD